MICAGIDVGFGAVKVAIGDENKVHKLFKFPSVVANVKKNELVKDSRIFDLDDSSFYVGEDALKLETSKIIDMVNYSNLETFSPLFLEKVIKDTGMVPDKVVFGLSIAHVKHSKYYKERLENYLKKYDKPISVSVIPQGIGCKLAFDVYGTTFPDRTKELASEFSYVGCDLGFNTLDMFQVISGKTSANLIRGLENKGIIRVVVPLLAHIKETHRISLSIKEGQEALSMGYFKRRGKTYDVKDVCEQLKANYLKELEDLIETEFGAILDKVDMIVLFGGGAYFFKSQESEFVKVANSSEYYNALGFYQRSLTI